MLHRSWALCAFVVFGFVAFGGCATSDDATRPRHKKKHAAPLPADPDDESAPAPAQDEPRASESKPAAPPVAEEPPRPVAEAPKDEPKDETKKAPVPARTAADPFGDVGFKEVNQKDWLAGLREKVAQQEKVPPTDMPVSPGLLRAAYVRSPPVQPEKPGRRAVPRRHEIVVVDNQGRRVATFRAVAAPHGDQPPKDLRFLSEERLVYEVVEPPPETPAPGKSAARKPRPAPRGKNGSAAPAPAHVAVTPLPPPRTFVIQPVTARARPLKCVGAHFTFTRDKDRLAFVSGSAESAFVAVDGAQVYPRRGRTVLASAPAWSKDGHSLAFLEAPSARPARLVLLAELDNPTGDTTWDLPPTAPLEGALVFWAGSGKLVVGKTQMRPVFSASFTKETAGR
jgi:hypothetical protein